MDLFELQTRANVLVEKVNAYEQSLTKENINENEVLAQQKFADIYCLRPVLKLLFGDNVTDKIDRVLNNDKCLPIYASAAPMWNTKFDLIPQSLEPTYSLNPNIQVVNASVDGNFIASNFSSSNFINLPIMNIGDEMILNIESYNNNSSSIQTILSYIEAPFLSQSYSDLRTQDYNGSIKYISKSTYYKYICIKLISNITVEIRMSNDLQEYGAIVTGSPRDRHGYNPSLLGGKWCFGSRPSNASSDTQSFYGKLNLKNSFIKRSDGSIERFVNVEYPKLVETDKHEFMNNIDIMNNHNMIQLDATQKSLTYNNEVYSDEEIRTRQGINYLYSSNIQDAVASESQIANIFKWNTTSDLEMKDNTITTYSQVPGIVMYYIGQGGFDFSYSPTVSHSDKSTLNSVSFEMPTYNGSLYLTSLKNGTAYNTKLIQSQDIFDNNPSYSDKIRFNLRMFIPGTHYTQGRLESPQQIWIPDIEPPEYIQHGTQTYNKSKYNYQSHALYHELVFKGRRSGAKENGFDFIPTLESVADNDPQGLATRLALAKNKDYYINRPWFNELNTEYEFDSSKLADEINKNSRYINSYYNLNTDYITNTDTSTYNKDKAQISSNSSKTPRLTSKINTGTDSDQTSPRTKYITGAFILDYDWSSIGTKENIQLFEQYNNAFYCGYTSSGISFGWKGFTAGGTTIIDIQELLDPNNKLLITYAFYGTRLFAGLNIYNKTTNEYIFKGPVYHEANVNQYTMTYNFNCTGVIIDLKPRGITIPDANGRAFNGDIGQMREFDSANSIDRLINLTDRIDIDRPMTDSEFYNTYKLDYNTYATAFELPQ